MRVVGVTPFEGFKADQFSYGAAAAAAAPTWATALALLRSASAQRVAGPCL